MSFLRKQESRFIPAQAGTQAIWSNMEFSYVLDSRLRGNDTLGLARQENGRLLHSAKMLRLFLICNTLADLKGGMCHCCVSRNPARLCRQTPPHPAWPKARPASPTRGEAGCSIRLKCYVFAILARCLLNLMTSPKVFGSPAPIPSLCILLILPIFTVFCKDSIFSILAIFTRPGPTTKGKNRLEPSYIGQIGIS